MDDRILKQGLNQQRRQRNVPQFLRQLDLIAQPALQAGGLDRKIGLGEIDFLTERAFTGTGARQRAAQQGGEVFQGAYGQIRIRANQLRNVGQGVEQEMRFDLRLHRLKFGLRQQLSLLRLLQFRLSQQLTGFTQALTGAKDEEASNPEEQSQAQGAEIPREKEQRLPRHERTCQWQPQSQAERDHGHRRKPRTEPPTEPFVRQLKGKIHRPADAERHRQDLRKAAGVVGQPPNQDGDGQRKEADENKRR